MKTHPLYHLLENLENAGIYFTLGRYHPDSITVSLTVPGERIEIYVYENGQMEVSRFKGHEGIVGENDLVDQIIEQYKD